MCRDTEIFPIKKKSSTKTMFTWTIEQYVDWASMIPSGQSEFSDDFHVTSEDGHDSCKFRLGIFPNGEDEQSKGIFSLYLENLDSDDAIVSYAFYAEKTNGSLKQSGPKFIKDKIGAKDSSGRSSMVISKMFTESGNHYINNGGLTLVCIIELVDEHNSELKKALTIKKKPIDIMKEFYNAKGSDNTNDFDKLSDYEIVCGSSLEKIFKCHKVVLAAGSPVFRAMLSHTTVIENKQSRVEISEIDPVTIDGMLFFLYTGNVSEKMITHNLFIAADKYQIEYLKAICELKLCSKMTNDNAVEVAIAAHLHGTNIFQEDCKRELSNKWNTIIPDKKEMLKSYPDFLISLMNTIMC